METTGGQSGIGALSPLLIANRGEIAVRVARTAGALGLRTVAVFTGADEGAPHIDAADSAVRVASYLDGQAIVDAATAAAARAVHPGYGFLSENAAFAELVEAAGLTWVGPPPGAIRVMGDKGRAKQLAEGAGVPVVPGTAGVQADAAAIEALAAEQGFPIVIKALAGGGGKGMRVVYEASQLDGSIEAARREAEAAFGDRRVLAERYLERPRHVEIQVLADSHGNTVHLGERECSLQRRHQKVIEEAPSPVVDPDLRGRMGAAAVALADACGYEGAGTVEFIVSGDEEERQAGSGFFFLEMNTRLQVEHPVTEMVWGVDLVEQQLRVAAGERLALSQDDLRPEGHAVEARLYAEDPAAGFLPATGTVLRLRVPGGEGIRFDSGIREGSVVGTSFDPMLAKLIAHGADRGEAIDRLDAALAELELLGVAHNGGFSRSLLALDEVRAGALDTGLLERVLAGGLETSARPVDLPLAGALGLWLEDTAELTIEPGPWRRRFEDLGEVRIAEGSLELLGRDAERQPARARLAPDGRLAAELDGVERAYAYAREGDSIWVGRDGHVLRLRLEHPRTTDAGADEGSLEAPMPGKVLSVEVANGDHVSAGDVLLILESMKMELQITAPHAGAVSGLSLTAGEQVAQGQALVAVAAADGGEAP